MTAALYHSLYVIIGGGILPAMIMMICAWRIRQNLSDKHKKRAQLSSGGKQRNPLDQQVLHILFVQIICYIIFTIPQLCNLVFNTISITIPNRSIEHLAIEAFVAFLAELMLYLFPVTSFYLYTLTSRTFRKELIKFFRLIFGRKDRIMPTIGGTTWDYHADYQKTIRHACENPVKISLAEIKS
ncbi:unnamed protein product [Rotaria sp. Silwood2]|nr:unnamed protein product [Rotaria sp. Silwood2]